MLAFAFAFAGFGKGRMRQIRHGAAVNGVVIGRQAYFLGVELAQPEREQRGN